MGQSTLDANTTGARNTAIGQDAMTSATTSSDNTAVGFSALLNKTTGFGNAAFGTRALQNVTTGHSNTAMGSSFAGYAGGSVTTGTFNVMLGTDAGYSVTTGGSNTCVGGGAGNAITTGGNNTIIGQGTNADASSYNAIVLGHGISGSSDYFYFGKAGNIVYNNFTSNASWARASDERWKKDIADNTDCGLDFINDLRTVTYKWKAPSELDSSLSEYNAAKTTAGYTGKMYGFLAQEVKQAMDDNSITDFAGWTVDATSDDDKQGVSYEMFVVPLVKAVQELKAELDAAKVRIAALEAE